jgi:hypothetical protein
MNPADNEASGIPRDAVPVERVLLVHVKDAETKPPARAPAAGKSDRALEWVKAIGMPIATLAVTVLGGYYFTTLTKEREARESNERLYAQLLTQREQSDSLVRKDMFGVVINRFLSDQKEENWSNKVLQLELLANNFSQSLDLAPLFKDLARQLNQRTGLTSAQSTTLKRRLDQTAANLNFKQVSSLARRGFVKSQQLTLGGWENSFGKPLIDESIAKSRLVPSTGYATPVEKDRIHFSVEVIDVSVDRREVEFRLRVDFPDKDAQDIDRHFWVGQYDFPMLDNTQLPYGLRTSVVITDFFVPDTGEDREANTFVNFHLVVFPAASASFKERQDYDDILIDMLRAEGRSSAGRQQP